LGSSHDILPGMVADQAFDLIHVDGDHSAEGARLDLVDSLKFVKENTVILFDDTDYADLAQVYAQFVERFKCEPVETIP
jgi:predicted O-methyltransferase YrrM